MANHTLIIDQGGHSTRAIVFNKKGEPVHFVSEPVSDPITEQDGFVEYDPQAIIDSVFVLLERLSTQLKPKTMRKISAAGLVAQRSSIVACQKHSGTPITPMISWQDTRHAQWLNQQAFDIDHLQSKTGLRLNAHMGASKITWLLDNDAQVQHYLGNNNLVFVPWGGFLAYHLCKGVRLVSDPVLAARTGLTAYGEAQWSDDLLRLFGIPQTCLPPIQPSASHYGELSLGAHKISLRLLGGDQNFIPYAYGEDHHRYAAFLNIGTGAFIQAVADNGCYSPLLKTSPAINGNNARITPVIEGTINGAASVLDWWQQQLPRPYTMGELGSLLETSTVVPIFINTLFGSGSPYWTRDKKPEFIASDNTSHTNEEKTVAVLESIIFAITINFEHIKKINPRIQHIIISGGLSKIDSLCQRLADLSMHTVYRYKDSEASARGLVFYMKNIRQYQPREPVEGFKHKQTGASAMLRARFNKVCEWMSQCE
ncbi:MAG: FGGY family carbohydrate kinase [Pseudomonadota bacterium]